MSMDFSIARPLWIRDFAPESERFSCSATCFWVLPSSSERVRGVRYPLTGFYSRPQKKEGQSRCVRSQGYRTV